MTHFLLLDDEDVFNFIHYQVITSVNPDAVITDLSSGQSALEFLRSRTGNSNALPDIILVDINMPEINGFDFLVIYQKEVEPMLTKKPKVYMVTSSLFESDRTRAKSFPAVTGFLEKPISVADIRKISNNPS